MKKLYGLQELRAVGCIMIFLTHTVYFTEWSYATVYGSRAVMLFFVMSGFLSYYKHKDNLGDDHLWMSGLLNWKRKYLSLLPLHLIMMGMVIIRTVGVSILGTTEYNWGKFVANAIVNGLLLQSYVPVMDVYYGLNGLTWFLSSLGLCYILIPCLIKKVKKCDVKQKWSWMILVFMTRSVLALQFTNPMFPDEVGEWIAYVCPFTRVLDFTMGILLCATVIEYTIQLRPAITTVFELVALCAFLACPRLINRGANEIMSLLLVVPLITAFLSEQGYLTKCLNTKAIMKCAALSGSFYLIHNVVISYVVGIGKHFFKLNNSVAFVICAVISIGASVIYDEIVKRYRSRRVVAG